MNFLYKGKKKTVRILTYSVSFRTGSPIIMTKRGYQFRIASKVGNSYRVESSSNSKKYPYAFYIVSKWIMAHVYPIF